MNTKLYVGNLEWSVGEDDLKAVFDPCGTVASVKIPLDRLSGRSRGYGFVEMSTHDEALKAIESLHGTPVKGREITVALQDPSRKLVKKNAKLFVSNLSPLVQEEELRTFFEQIGDVMNINIPQDRESGQGRGFAFVEMASQEMAETAINLLNEAVLDNQPITIYFQDASRQSRPYATRP